MCNPLQLDKAVIEELRDKGKLMKPSEFPEGILTPAIFEALVPLMTEPFDEANVKTSHQYGFESKSIPLQMLINRLQDVVGVMHLHINHTDVQFETEQKTDESRRAMYSCKCRVQVQFGNYERFGGNLQAPESTFVPVYQTHGIGYGIGTNRGRAEKASLGNGIKEALKDLGVLRYLYIENESDESDEDENQYTTKFLRIIETPKLQPVGSVFATCKVRDVLTGEPGTAIVYSNNTQNSKHSLLKDFFEQPIKPGDVLVCEAKYNLYQGKPQYIIKNAIRKD